MQRIIDARTLVKKTTKPRNQRLAQWNLNRYRYRVGGRFTLVRAYLRPSPSAIESIEAIRAMKEFDKI